MSTFDRLLQHVSGISFDIGHDRLVGIFRMDDGRVFAASHAIFAVAPKTELQVSKTPGPPVAKYLSEPSEEAFRVDLSSLLEWSCCRPFVVPAPCCLEHITGERCGCGNRYVANYFDPRGEICEINGIPFSAAALHYALACIPDTPLSRDLVVSTRGPLDPVRITDGEFELVLMPRDSRFDLSEATETRVFPEHLRRPA